MPFEPTGIRLDDPNKKKYSDIKDRLGPKLGEGNQVRALQDNNDPGQVILIPVDDTAISSFKERFGPNYQVLANAAELTQAPMKIRLPNLVQEGNVNGVPAVIMEKIHGIPLWNVQLRKDLLEGDYPATEALNMKVPTRDRVNALISILKFVDAVNRKGYIFFDFKAGSFYLARGAKGLEIVVIDQVCRKAISEQAESLSSQQWNGELGYDNSVEEMLRILFGKNPKYIYKNSEIAGEFKTKTSSVLFLPDATKQLIDLLEQMNSAGKFDAIPETIQREVEDLERWIGSNAIRNYIELSTLLEPHYQQTIETTKDRPAPSTGPATKPINPVTRKAPVALQKGSEPLDPEVVAEEKVIRDLNGNSYSLLGLDPTKLRLETFSIKHNIKFENTQTNQPPEVCLLRDNLSERIYLLRANLRGIEVSKDYLFLLVEREIKSKAKFYEYLNKHLLNFEYDKIAYYSEKLLVFDLNALVGREEANKIIARTS